MKELWEEIAKEMLTAAELFDTIGNTDRAAAYRMLAKFAAQKSTEE